MAKVGILYDNISGNTGDVAIGLSLKKILREIGVEFDELVPGNFNPNDYETIIIGGGHLIRPSPDFFYDKFKVPGKHILNAIGILDSPDDLHYLNDYKYVTVRTSWDKERLSYLEQDVHLIPCTTMLLEDLEDFALAPKSPSLGIHLLPNIFNEDEEKQFVDWASSLPFTVYLIPITHYNRDYIYLGHLSSKIKNSVLLPLMKPLEIFTFIGKLNYFIGCSLHGGIFSYIHNVPFILFNYNEKMFFFMKDRELQQYTFTNYQSMRESFDILFSDSPDYSEKISEDLDLLKRHVDYLKQILPSGGLSQGIKTDNQVQTNHQIHLLQSQARNHETKLRQYEDSTFRLIGQLKDASDRIKANDQSLAEASNQVQTLERDVAERDNQIATVSDHLQEASNQVQTLERDVAERDNQIATISDQFEQAKARELSLGNEIAEIKGSVVWQLTMRFHNGFCEKALPHGTRRRNSYDLCLKAGRILINEGSGNLCKQSLTYLRQKKNSGAKVGVENWGGELLYALDSHVEVFETGFGTGIYLKGWCFHTNHEIIELRLHVGSQSKKVFNFGLPGTDVYLNFLRSGKRYRNSISSRFWCIFPVEGVKNEVKVEVTIEAILANGETVIRKFQDILIKPRCHINQDTQIKIKNFVNSIKNANLGSHVVICLATYNPDKELFKNQIDSIRTQTYKNWSCIINDDCSKLNKYSEIVSTIGDDERFVVFQNEKNLGFYYNYERLLRLVPSEADFVALSDQDDHWYEDKIEKLIKKFDSETTLVYSDMRIVDRHGICMSSTFWTTRKNYYDDLDYLILANTVTGAALIFRASLLSYILPFPERIGDSFHDHWIACVANALGKIAYIDEALYDYYQHSNNVLGQATFEKGGLSSYLKVLATLRNLNVFKSKVFYYQYVYCMDGARLILIATCLLLRIRCSGKNKKVNRLYKFIRLESSSKDMFMMKLKTFANRKTTADAEVRLFCSYWANRVMRSKIVRKHLLAAIPEEKKALVSARIYNYENVKNKISPINLKISKDHPERVNLIIPSIDFRYFFGGYIAKFNLAKKLVENGFDVRVILVDQDSIDMEECKIQIKKYSGLENIFDLISLVCILDRSKELPVSPRDAFVATTWWTAHIAHDAAIKLGSNGFLYLIQEFEPFTFPMGTYYALAMQSYSFPHYALFSTELLQEYFEINRIGVYSGDLDDGTQRSTYFENAIGKFEIDPSSMRNRKVKKLLFYARPEEHAARNMFDLGMIALQEAVNRGIFSPAEWEFYGMGSIGSDKFYPMNEEVNITVLPKVSLNEYYDLLKQFDLGLSLMYTPHPSLPPLEMAAAGLIVVTNTCLNKNPDKLSSISKNILGVSPTVEDVVNGLELASSLVKDYDRRIEGSQVKWANDWEKALNKGIMARVFGFIEELKSKECL